MVLLWLGVCTMGVGLVLLIPVAYLIGLLLTVWWIPFLGPVREARKGRGLSSSDPAQEGNSQSAGNASPPPLPRQARIEQSLQNFVAAATSNGMDADETAGQLRDAGWDETDIQYALRAIEKMNGGRELPPNTA